MVWLGVDMPSHVRLQPGQAAAWTSQSGQCCRRFDTARKMRHFTDFIDYRLSRHHQLTISSLVCEGTDQNFVLGELDFFMVFEESLCLVSQCCSLANAAGGSTGTIRTPELFPPSQTLLTSCCDKATIQ